MEAKLVQEILNNKGFGPLVLDGNFGPKSVAALKRFQKSNGLPETGKLDPSTERALALCQVKPSIIPKANLKVLSSKEMLSKYGQPAQDSNLVHIDLPFPMRIAWNLSQSTSRIKVHKLVAPKLKAALQEILQVYGLAKIQKLGIDLYGGCYNPRPKRGLEAKHAAAVRAGKHDLAITYLSKHSWGTAIDLDPARNTLKATHKTAQFAKPEYKDMIDIFYKHGFVSYGREDDYDWMHFEIGE